MLNVDSLRKFNDTVIIDETAHLPTEIIATLRMRRQRNTQARKMAVFQPSIPLQEPLPCYDFAHALNQADAVYLAQIYGTRLEVDQMVVKVEETEPTKSKKHQVKLLENVSPLLETMTTVYTFMEEQDIQTYIYSFERLLSHLTKAML